MSSLDWASRYRGDDTPWDLGQAHPELVARIGCGELGADASGARALVPGCGRGHDALALAGLGFAVLAIDLVAELGGELGPALAARGGRFEAGDALALEVERPFDLIWEHTFFSAVEPRRRADWGALCRRALRVGGRLAALAFPADRPDDLGGPPWRTGPDELAAALGDGFRERCRAPAAHPGAGRRWREWWVSFERI